MSNEEQMHEVLMGPKNIGWRHYDFRISCQAHIYWRHQDDRM